MAALPPQDAITARLRLAADACLANADQLLNSANVLLDNGGEPRVAFHLGTLALEEIGKSGLLRVAISARLGGREIPAFVTKGLDDHVKKLFWAIWGQSMRDGQITRQEIETNQQLATHLHETRLRGLYVDVTPDALGLPDGVIDAAMARSVVEMARARRQLEPQFDYDNIPLERRERIEWFVNADRRS